MSETNDKFSGIITCPFEEGEYENVTSGIGVLLANLSVVKIGVIDGFEIMPLESLSEISDINSSFSTKEICVVNTKIITQIKGASGNLYLQPIWFAASSSIYETGPFQ
jgi:hypothetical protein